MSIQYDVTLDLYSEFRMTSHLTSVFSIQYDVTLDLCIQAHGMLLWLYWAPETPRTLLYNVICEII